MTSVPLAFKSFFYFAFDYLKEDKTVLVRNDIEISFSISIFFFDVRLFYHDDNNNNIYKQPLDEAKLVWGLV